MAGRREDREKVSSVDHRSTISWAIRSGSHLAIGLVEPGIRRLRPRRVLGTAAALAVDWVHRDWLANDRLPHRVPRFVIDAADGVVWTLLGNDTYGSAMRIRMAASMTTAVEAGFRIGAGTDAVPVVEPRRPFPPPTGTRTRAALETLGPLVATNAVMAVARRARGVRWHPFTSVSVGMSIGLGFVAARHRDRLQRLARERWLQRADHQVSLERASAGIGAAVQPSVAHDFKKNLVALALAGSEPARRASGEQQVHPAIVLSVHGGTTLLRAAIGIPIEPASHGDVWISDEHRAELDAFIDAVDELEAPDGSARIVVSSVEGLNITLRYRGRPLTLANPPPVLGSIDPVPVAALAMAATWKVIAVVNPTEQVPWRAVAPGLALDLAALGVALGSPVRDRLNFCLAAAAASTALCHVRLARNPSDAGHGDDRYLTPAMLGAAPVVLASAYWRTANRAVSVGAVAAAAGGFALVAGRMLPRSPRAALLGAILLWEGFTAAFDAVSAFHAEVDALDADLQVTFGHIVRSERARAARREFDRYEEQVDLAERELVVFRDALDPEIAEFIDDQCEVVREWIAAQRTAT